MVDRPNKPSALASTPTMPQQQPQVDITHDQARVQAKLPTGESVEVLLHGATVISWKDSKGDEKLWMSDKAVLDGSKPVRGGIPLVFPVFGTAPDHAATSSLPSHGFARNSTWSFLGKSTSESDEEKQQTTTDSSVKLDFGLSKATLGDAAKKAWPYNFSLIYSVTLSPGALSTAIVISNDNSGDAEGQGQSFDCQVLMHTYLRVSDIAAVSVAGLEGASFVDKVDGASTKTQEGAISISGEMDRVYRSPGKEDKLVEVQEKGSKRFAIARDNLDEVVVWNPWAEKAAGMGDFEPKEGYKNMICVEAGAVREWQKLDPGDAFEGSQTIYI